MSLLRRFLPLTRTAGKLWTVPSRNASDIPVRKGPFWDMGWPYPYLRPWSDIWDDHQRQYLQRMDKIIKSSPGTSAADNQEVRDDVRTYGPDSDVGRIEMNKEKLLMQMEFNVTKFEPDDLFVNVTGDWLIINGQHAIRADKFGYVSRHFTRQIHLPEGLDKDTITGRYTENGRLLMSIKAVDEDGFTRVQQLYDKSNRSQ